MAKIYFKFLKYEDLIKLKLPFKPDGKNWTIKRVDVNEEMKQLFVSVEIHKPRIGNETKRFTISRNQQLKLDNLGTKVQIVKYSLLQEAFRRKVHSIGIDIDIIFRRKYPTVLKIEEDSVSEIGVNRRNAPLMFNSIMLVHNEDGFEFYVTNNKVANMNHIRMINQLQLMTLFVDPERK